MDLSAIPAILTSIKTATDLTKLIIDSGHSLKDAENKLKLSAIITALADANIKIAEIQQHIIEKENEINTLNKKLILKNKMNWEHPYYWKIEGEKKEGPYCQQCYDKKGELIRLQGNNEGYWECKTCKNNFRDSTYKPTSGVVGPGGSQLDDF